MNQLNFPYNQLMGNPDIQFGPNYTVPFPNVRVDPSVQNLTSMVSCELANATCQNARKNDARVYTFNAVSNNNFQNQEFAEVTQLSLDYLAMKMSQNAISGDIGQYIRTLTQNVMQFKTSVFITQFPILLDAAGNDKPRLMGLAQQDLQQYQGLWGEINNWRNRMQNTGGYGNQGGYNYGGNQGGGFPVGNQGHQGGGYNNGGYGNPGGYPQAQQRPGYGNPHQPAQRASAAGIGMATIAQSVFTPTASRGNGAAMDPSIEGDRYAVMAAMRQERAAQAPAQVVTQVETQPVELVAARDWYPTTNQPHPPVVNAANEKAVLTAINASPGSSEAAIYQIVNLTKEEQVERDKHILAGVDKNIASYVPHTQVQRMEGADLALRKIVETEERFVEGKLAAALKEVFYIDPDKEIVATNLDEAIACARYIHKAVHGKETSAKAFRVDCAFTQVLIASQDYGQRLNDLRQCRNFTALAQRMNAILASSAEEQEFKEMIYKLDRWLTARLNDLLYNRMSVMTCTVDSFCSDHNKLFDYLRTNKAYGELYVDALTGHQPEFITDWLNFQEDTKVFAGLAHLDFESPGMSKPVVRGVDNHVSITCLEVLYDELNIGFPNGVHAGEIMQSLPSLRNYAAGLLAEPKREGATRHFIVTLDDVVLELHQGLLVRGAVMASIVNR